jgi:hypothetical protein
MYSLGTWFVSGVYVWIPCIKETMMMMMMMMIVIIITITIIIIDENVDVINTTYYPQTTETKFLT